MSESDDYDEEGDYGRQKGSRKKPESRQRYMEDDVDDYTGWWPETETLPWPSDADQLGYFEQQMQEDRKGSSKHD